MGYAPGLALQVIGVSDFFGSGFDSALLLLSSLRLLDRLGDQLVGDFVRGVYMYEKNAMQQIGHSATHECSRCDAFQNDAMPCGSEVQLVLA